MIEQATAAPGERRSTIRPRSAFVASARTFLRHPDGPMVALEPGMVLDGDDPLVAAYPHLFTVEAPAKKAPAKKARKK